MGKVFAPPSSIKKPEFNVAYIEQVVTFAKANGKGKLAGEVISFPVADGSAQYVVYSTSPVVLIHLPIGDAWQYDYANRLNATDIKEKVRQSQAISKLFSAKAGGK